MSDRDRRTTEAVDLLADVLSRDLMDSTWGSLSCTEAETFAHVFTCAGYDDLAHSVIEQHSWHDEDGDEHYDPANEQLHRSLHT